MDLRVSDRTNRRDVTDSTAAPGEDASNLFNTLMPLLEQSQGQTLAAAGGTGTADIDGPSSTAATALAATPGNVLDFVRNAFGGFVWAGIRDFRTPLGAYTVTVAIISPKRGEQVFQGDDLGSALGNLGVNVADAVLPNVTGGTYFFAIKGPNIESPYIVTYNPATKQLESGIPTGAAVFTFPPGADGRPDTTNPNIFGFSNIRAGDSIERDPTDTTIDLSLNTGLTLRARPLERVMQQVVGQLYKFALQSYIRAAATAPTGAGAIMNSIAGTLALAGGSVLDDWKIFWGPAFRASMTLDTTDLGATTFSANGQTISYSDLRQGFEQFISDAANAAQNVLRTVTGYEEPFSFDDALVTPRVTNSDGSTSPNRDIISYQVSTALNNGVDAFSLLRTAWDVWDNRSNGENLRANAAAVFNSFDPRMAIARDFVTAFYSGADSRGQPLNFARLDAAGRAEIFEQSGLKFYGRDAFGDFRISNAGNLLGLGGAYGRFVTRQAGEAEFNARVQAFAEQVTRRGFTVNLGIPQIELALQQARAEIGAGSTDRAGFRPADNEPFITSYFARTDLQKATSSFVSPDLRSENPVLTVADISNLFLSAGTGGGAAGAWPRIFEEVSLGRMDLFEALAAVEAAGGAGDPTSIAVKRLQTDLTALLTAPLTNREFQVDRDGLEVPPDIAALRQRRADFLAAYRAEPTFDNLLTALRSRIEIEPQFADVLQGYLFRRGISLPDGQTGNLFASALPGVGMFSSAADLTRLPGTVTEDGVTTNPYLPADFFEQVPQGASYDATLSFAQGRQIADYITQYDLKPGEELVVQRPPAFNPGVLPPRPEDDPSRPGRDDEGPYVWWDYYTLPNDSNFYWAPGNFGYNPYKVRLDDIGPITPGAAQAYQAGGFAGLVTYVNSNNDPTPGRPFRFDDFVAANPDLPDNIKADPLQALDYYLTQGIYEGRPTSLSDVEPQRAERPSQPITNVTAFLNDPQNLLGYLASQEPLTRLVAEYGVADGGRLRSIANDYVLRNLGDPEKSSITFDPATYFAANPEVAAALGNDLSRAAEHYLTVGYLAGLPAGAPAQPGEPPVIPPAPDPAPPLTPPSPPVTDLASDTSALSYIASYPDLIAASRGLSATDAAVWARVHFANHGQGEGRSIAFDPVLYGQLNPDVQAAYAGDPAMMAYHYLVHGSIEGRRTA